MKTKDEVGDLSPDLLKAQIRLLESAAQNGPAECFLRRTISWSVRLEGGGVLGSGCADRTEIALRLIRGDRVGLCGGSFASGDKFIDYMVSCAEKNAKSGPIAGSEFVPGPPSLGCCHVPAFPKPADLAALGSDLLAELHARYPSFLWSGEIAVRSRLSRIVHSGGFDGWSARQEYRLHLRARCPASGVPVDRLLEVLGRNWDDVSTLCKARIDAEFPESEDVYAAPRTADIAMGAPVVSVLCGAFALGYVPESICLSPQVTIWDEPTINFEGCDEEGAVVSPLTLVDRGRVSRWEAAGAELKLPGRAFRNAIDAPPTLALLGLHWQSPVDSLPPTSILYRELAGLSVQPDGQIRGTATEGIVLRNGKPVYRCRGNAIRMAIQEAFGERLSGMSGQLYASGRHRLPIITVSE